MVKSAFDRARLLYCLRSRIEFDHRGRTNTQSVEKILLKEKALSCKRPDPSMTRMIRIISLPVRDKRFKKKITQHQEKQAVSSVT